MLKRFFYASAAVLMFALAFHLGASTTAAQGQVVATVGFDTYDRPIIAVGHSLYEMWDTNEILTLTTVPGTSPVVGIRERTVVLENGDVYGASAGQWQLRGNFFGGQTPTQQQSWGQLKSRYR